MKGLPIVLDLNADVTRYVVDMACVRAKVAKVARVDKVTKLVKWYFY